MDGFAAKDVATLQHIKEELDRVFTYRTDEEKYHMAEYWADDQILLPTVEHNAPLEGDCEDYSMAAMQKAMNAGFKARLVVCLTELKGGHCICEVSSADGKQAYYFDNRRHGLVGRQGLTSYYFYSASPWNPQPGEHRPWLLIQQPSH